MKRATPTLGTVKRQRSATNLSGQIAASFWDALMKPKPVERVVEPEKTLPPLSDEQQAILNTILLEEKNAFITGGAGTGKSRIIHAIYEGLKAQTMTTVSFDANDRVVETTKKRWRVKTMAPTGVAGLLLPNGRTYHKIFSCGISEKTHVMLSNATQDKKDRKFSAWKTGGQRYAFIIDEAYMISGHQMDRLDTMMRQLSQCDAPFGGHRVILVGDPYQLGPVKKSERLLHTSSFFQSVEHRFVLTRCFRQENASFVALLDRVRRGVPTAEDHARLSALQSNKVENCMNLVPTKKQAARLNADALQAIPGKSRIYRAKDTVYDASYASMLDDLMAPKELELKLGSRVMIIRNINSVVVNGTTGVVTAMENNSIDIQITNGGIITVNPFEFTIEKAGTVKVKRIAFPIMPSDASNIHKAQGLSLDRVFIDCEDMFAYGQFYVALSRCRSEQGLVLKNYSPSAIKVDPSVVNFMRTIEK